MKVLIALHIASHVVVSAGPIKYDLTDHHLKAFEFLQKDHYNRDLYKSQPQKYVFPELIPTNNH